LGCVQKPVEKKPIKLVFDKWVGYYIVYLAKEKGLFEKNGVQVDLASFEKYSDVQAAFEKGDADAAMGVYADAIMRNGNGISTKVVYAIDNSITGDALVGKKGQTISGLQGKTVGIDSVNTFSHLLVLKLFEKNNVTEGLVNIKVIPASEVLAALEKGEIDAGHVWEPFKTQVIQKGYAVLGTAGEVKGIVTDVLEFKEEAIADRPLEVRAIIKSLAEACEFLKTHRKEAVKIMASSSGIGESALESQLEGIELMGLEENKRVMTKTGEDNLFDSGNYIAQIYLKRGVFSKNTEISSVIDASFVASVAKD
jgi:NitT/TauT family transport system substrate-binding protein